MVSSGVADIMIENHPSNKAADCEVVACVILDPADNSLTYSGDLLTQTSLGVLEAK